MVRTGEIRGVHIRSAAQHGLGIFDVQGWIRDSSVEEASAESAGGFSAVKVVSAGEGSRVEDLYLVITDCDHAVDADSQIRLGGIHTHGTPVNDRYSVATSTIWSRAFTSPYSLGGTLVVGTGTFRLPFSYGARVIAVRAAVGVAPTGSAIIVDVHKNGTTLFTTQSERPTIAVSTNLSNIAVPDIIDIDPGDYLTIDIDQIGSTVAGEDLVVNIQMENDD